MKRNFLAAIAAASLAMTGLGSMVMTAAALAASPVVVINVTSRTDGANTDANSSCTSGTLGCTLRAAIEYADALATAASPSHVVVNIPAGDYRLTIGGTPLTGLSQDDSSNGDLHLSASPSSSGPGGGGKITLAGAGAATTFITQTVAERVIKLDPSATAEISGLTIRGGVASNSPGDVQSTGGGIDVCEGGSLNLHDAVVTRNQAQTDITTGGGAIRNGQGGGIAVEPDGGCGFGTAAGSATILRSVITDNTADESGAGLFNGGTLSIDSSTISNNRLTGPRAPVPNSSPAGGGIYLASGTIDVGNSTIAGNTAPDTGGGGGGVYAAAGTVGKLHEVTLAGNSAGAGLGGGLRLAGTTASRVTVKNSIIANKNGGNCAFGTGQALIDGKYNLESANTCGFTTANQDITNTDPQLGPLAVTYGTTPTMSPKVGSKAIDAIPTCPPPALDQRGIVRPQQGLCDIGAVEVIIPTVSAVSPSCVPTDGGATLTVTGTGFTNARGVTVGGASAIFSVLSDTSLTAISQAGSGPVDVVVQGLDGSSAVSPADQTTLGCPKPSPAPSPPAGATAPIRLPNTSGGPGGGGGLGLVALLLAASAFCGLRARRPARESKAR